MPEKRYPPKRLLFNAIVLGGLGNWGFTGGEATNRHIRFAGFPVVLKTALKADELKLVRLALKAGQQIPSKTVREASFVHRSGLVSAWVKQVAGGKCALCDQPAPFIACDEPFLESHHVKWLRNGGSDTIDNVVALCPNCHRRMHALNAAEDVRRLQTAIKRRYASQPADVRVEIDRSLPPARGA